MAHRDIDSLAERLRRAREAKGSKTRAYTRRSTKQRNLSPSRKRELVDNLIIAKEQKDRAVLELDAVILQAYKAGLPANAISDALGLRSHGYIYNRIGRLMKEYQEGSKSAVKETSPIDEV